MRLLCSISDQPVQVNSSRGFSVEYFPTYKASWVLDQCGAADNLRRLSAAAATYLLLSSQRPITRSLTHPTHPSSLSPNPLPATQVVTNSIAGETYVLSQCGAQVPPASQFPEGTKFFTVPLVSLSAPETVPYAFVVRRVLELGGDAASAAAPARHERGVVPAMHAAGAGQPHRQLGQASI